MENITFLDVVAIGLESWGTLALGIGILFVAIVILKKLTGNKKKDK